MPITSSIDNEKQLTIHTAMGEVSFEDGMTTLRQFWEGQPTINVLWDLRKASLARVTSEETEAIMNYIQQHSEKRSGGKTALVVSGELEYGLSRMSQSLGEIKNLSLQMEVFRSFKKAMQWLGDET